LQTLSAVLVEIDHFSGSDCVHPSECLLGRWPCAECSCWIRRRPADRVASRGLAREALERARAINRFLAGEYQPLLDQARKGSLDVPANLSGVERVVQRHGP